MDVIGDAIMITLISSVFIFGMGYIIVSGYKHSRKILQDDILRTDEVKVRLAEASIRRVRFMVPVLFGMVAIYVYVMICCIWHVQMINLIGLAFYAFGLLFAYIGIILKKSESGKHAKYQGACKGIVVDVKEQRKLSSNADHPHYHVYYIPVVKYVVNGTEYTQQCSSGSDKNSAPKVGEELNVYYDTQCPEFMETDFDRNVGENIAIIFIALGILFVVIGVHASRSLG